MHYRDGDAILNERFNARDDRYNVGLKNPTVMLCDEDITNVRVSTLAQDGAISLWYRVGLFRLRRVRPQLLPAFLELWSQQCCEYPGVVEISEKLQMPTVYCF